jgi:hypothetical protein
MHATRQIDSQQQRVNKRDVECPCVYVSACMCENKNDRETRKESQEQTREIKEGKEERKENICQ